MIVLGPLDADLCGAPDYWREGNWRPPSPQDIMAGSHGLGLMPSIPFDRCDAVLVYDARNLDAPMPRDQGWEERGDGNAARHEPERGTLLIEADEGRVLGYMGAARGRLERMPQYVACTTCGFVFQNPTLEPHEIHKLYAMEYRPVDPPSDYRQQQQGLAEQLYKYVERFAPSTSTPSA
mgnify:FL=1